jgi:hypothetical protein
MDICVCIYSVFVLSRVQVAALRRAVHSFKESYRLCKKDYETEEEARAQQMDVGHWWMSEWMNEWNYLTWGSLLFSCRKIQGQYLDQAPTTSFQIISSYLMN